jgi:hypothetical protein
MAQRPEAFARIAIQTFEAWHCAAPIHAAIAHYSELPRALDSLRLLAAHSSTQEGSDLLREAGGRPRHAALAIRATHFSEPDFAEFVEIEIGRLNDLVDPDFGYDPDREPQSQSPAGRKQAIGRLGALWTASLAMRRQNPATGSRRASADVGRWFGVPVDDATKLVQSILESGVTYAALVHAAEEPEKVLGALGIQIKLARARRGEPCPLCSFPTTSWADDEALSSMHAAVREDFPAWQPQAGACDRCAEIYVPGAHA